MRTHKGMRPAHPLYLGSTAAPTCHNRLHNKQVLVQAKRQRNSFTITYPHALVKLRDFVPSEGFLAVPRAPSTHSHAYAPYPFGTPRHTLTRGDPTQCVNLPTTTSTPQRHVPAPLGLDCRTRAD